MPGSHFSKTPAPGCGTVAGMSNRKDLNVWPSVTADDALALRAWLVGLGFREGICVTGQRPGEVVHSEMYWPEGGRLMVASRSGEEGDEFEVPRGAMSCYVVTADPDAVWARAKDLGARVIRELADSDYGSRGFSIADIEGNVYSFGSYAGS